MPVLKDYRTIKSIVLPITKAKVSLYNTLLTGEIEQVYQINGSDVKKSVKMLSLMIKEWNLTDKDENILPFTEENLSKLPIEDITVMINTTDFAQKKNQQPK